MCDYLIPFAVEWFSKAGQRTKICVLQNIFNPFFFIISISLNKGKVTQFAFATDGIEYKRNTKRSDNKNNSNIFY